MYAQQGGQAPPAAAPQPSPPSATPQLAPMPSPADLATIQEQRRGLNGSLLDPIAHTFPDPQDSSVHRDASTGEVVAVDTSGGTGAPDLRAVSSDPAAISAHLSARGISPAWTPAPVAAPASPGGGAPSAPASPPPGPPGPPPPPNPLAGMSDANLTAAYNAATAPPGPAPNVWGGGDPGTPTTLLGRVGRDLDSGVRQAANFVTGGWADKFDAALSSAPALLQGGLPAATRQYSANLDADKARDASDWREAPGAFVAGAVPGMLAQGMFLPEAKAATLGGRLTAGALGGAVAGAFNGSGEARGGLGQVTAGAAAGAAGGAVLGGAFGSIFGPRLPSEAFQPPVANLSDYARVGVDPMLAVNGSETAQRFGQILHGTPLAGLPIQAQAAKSGRQAAGAFAHILGGYGEGAAPEAAGSLITSASQDSAAAASGARQSAASAILDQASRYGAPAGRRQAGEAAQDVVGRFAGGDPAANPSEAFSSPSRTTSFDDRAGARYDSAFERIDSEMAGRDAPPYIQETMGPGMLSGTVVGTVEHGGSQIAAPRTAAVIGDIRSRAQSPQVRGLLEAPEISRVAGAVGDSKNLSFRDLRSLRTWVRQAQKDPELRRNIGQADLQRMEGALTGDIYDNAARLASPEAATALRRADQFYAAGMGRIASALAPFAKAGSGEAAFDRVLGAAQAGGRANIASLRSLRSSMRPDEWSGVAASVIDHIGTTPQGFALDRFVAGFDKLSPEGADVLFGGRNAAVKTALDHLVQRGRDALAEGSVTHFGQTPSAAFAGLLAAAKSGGRAADVAAIHGLRSAVSASDWGDIGASVLKSIGTKADTDGHFDFSRFSTEWGKMSAGAKDALFGGPGREKDVAALDSLARISEQMKRSSKFYNHSNSGHAGGAIVGMLEAGRAAAEGKFHELAGLGAAATLGAGAAKLFASPGVARLVLRSLKASGPEEEAAVDAALGTKAAEAPKVAKEIGAFRQNLRKIRANAPQTTGAALATMPQRQELQQQ